MTISVIYPLFVLMDGKVPVVVEGVDGEERSKAFAVFTDWEAAHQYRDEHFQSAKVGRIPDEDSFAKAVVFLKGFVSVVAFDPYRVGKRTQTVTVEEMLQQLPKVQ